MIASRIWRKVSILAARPKRLERTCGIPSELWNVAFAPRPLTTEARQAWISSAVRGTGSGNCSEHRDYRSQRSLLGRTANPWVENKSVRKSRGNRHGQLPASTEQWPFLGYTCAARENASRSTHCSLRPVKEKKFCLSPSMLVLFADSKPPIMRMNHWLAKVRSNGRK